MNIQRPADKYTPIYFLASVGAGGLTVTFFMYLLFWVPHPGRAVPVFEDITTAFSGGSAALKAAILLAMAGIALFTFLNLKYLFWNLSAYRSFRATEAFRALRESNAETTLLAMPLALAMSINALFIAGMVFVPGLWSAVEYLFPFAMAAFLAIGVIALSVIGDFLGRVLSRGGVFDVTANNSFTQLVPVFALAMIAVGLSAPAAMSTNATVVGISLVGSTFFGVAAVVYGVIALIVAFNSMLHYGTAREAAPTLMIVIPILTTLGIMFIRQAHGLHTQFEGHTSPGETLTFLARIVAVQFAFLGLGLVVLRQQRYFSDFVFGSKTSPGSYALVCPGVALSVMLFFFTNKGLVATGIIEKFGTAYWIVTGLAILFQLAMVVLLFRLNRQHFAKAPQQVVPAE